MFAPHLCQHFVEDRESVDPPQVDAQRWLVEPAVLAADQASSSTGGAVVAL